MHAFSWLRTPSACRAGLRVDRHQRELFSEEHHRDAMTVSTRECRSGEQTGGGEAAWTRAGRLRLGCRAPSSRHHPVRHAVETTETAVNDQ